MLPMTSFIFDPMTSGKLCLTRNPRKYLHLFIHKPKIKHRKSSYKKVFDTNFITIVYEVFLILLSKQYVMHAGIQSKIWLNSVNKFCFLTNISETGQPTNTYYISLERSSYSVCADCCCLKYMQKWPRNLKLTIKCTTVYNSLFPHSLLKYG